jgi:exodeoxyribonuclease VII small subunit
MADTPPPEELTYEQAVEELEAIIERIEQGQVGLEESLAQYRRGAALLKRCRMILDDATRQIEELTAQETEE